MSEKQQKSANEEYPFHLAGFKYSPVIMLQWKFEGSLYLFWQNTVEW